MIKAEEFNVAELENILKTLIDFRDVKDHLDEWIKKYFAEFDSDNNGFLDRKELRQFLK